MEELQEPISDQMKHSLSNLLTFHSQEEDDDDDDDEEEGESPPPASLNSKKIDTSEQKKINLKKLLDHYSSLQHSIEGAAKLLLSSVDFLSSQCNDRAPLVSTVLDFQRISLSTATNNLLSTNVILGCLSDPCHTAQVRHFGSLLRFFLVLLDFVMEKKRQTNITYLKVSKFIDSTYISQHFMFARDSTYIEDVPLEYKEIPAGNGDGTTTNTKTNNNQNDNQQSLEGEDEKGEGGKENKKKTITVVSVDIKAQVRQRRKEAEERAKIRIKQLNDEMEYKNRPLTRKQKHDIRIQQINLKIEQGIKIQTNTCGLTKEQIKYLFSKKMLKPYIKNINFDEDGIPEYLDKYSVKGLYKRCSIFNKNTLESVACPHFKEEHFEEIIEHAIEHCFNKNSAVIFDLDCLSTNIQSLKKVQKTTVRKVKKTPAAAAAEEEDEEDEEEALPLTERRKPKYAMLKKDMEFYLDWAELGKGKFVHMNRYICDECEDKYFPATDFEDDSEIDDQDYYSDDNNDDDDDDDDDDQDNQKQQSEHLVSIISDDDYVSVDVVTEEEGDPENNSDSDNLLTAPQPSIIDRDPPSLPLPPTLQLPTQLPTPLPLLPVPSLPVVGAPSAPPLAPSVFDEQVAQFLRNLNLNQVVQIFSTEQIDMETLLLLDDSDLKEMDIPLGPRKKILKAIKDA